MLLTMIARSKQPGLAPGGVRFGWYSRDQISTLRESLRMFKSYAR